MNDNIKKIIELSDCEWIQEKWKPREGDYAITDYGEVVLITTSQLGEGLLVARTEDYGQTACVGREYHEVGVWLPIGFNPDTGNWQVDDLLMEVLGYKGQPDGLSVLRRKFEKFVHSPNQGKTDFEFQAGTTRTWDNDLILKLIWLRELIEEISHARTS